MLGSNARYFGFSTVPQLWNALIADIIVKLMLQFSMNSQVKVLSLCQIIVKCADWVYNSIVDRLSEGSSWTSWRNRHGLGLSVLVSKFMCLGGSVLVMMMTTLMFQVGVGLPWFAEMSFNSNCQLIKSQLKFLLVSCSATFDISVYLSDQYSGNPTIWVWQKCIWDRKWNR